MCALWMCRPKSRMIKHHVSCISCEPGELAEPARADLQLWTTCRPCASAANYLIQSSHFPNNGWDWLRCCFWGSSICATTNLVHGRNHTDFQLICIWISLFSVGEGYKKLKIIGEYWRIDKQRFTDLIPVQCVDIQDGNKLIKSDSENIEIVPK